MADRQTVGLSSAAAYAKARGLSLSQVRDLYDVVDDRDNPDTPDGLQHLASLPGYGEGSKSTYQLPRHRGDVIDQLARRRGGQLPRRSQGITESRDYIREHNIVPPSEFTTHDMDWKGMARSAGEGLLSTGQLLDFSDPITASVNAGAKAGSDYIKENQRLPNHPGVAASRTALRQVPLVGDLLASGSAPTVGYGYEGRPPSKDENNEAAGALGTTVGLAAGGKLMEAGGKRMSPVPIDPLGAGTELETAALPRREKITPQQSHAHKINDTIGQGSINAERDMNLGEVLAQNDMPVDEREVKRDPLTLTRHLDAMVDRENLAADHMLRTPEATAPTVDATKVFSEPDTALLSTADVKAVESVRNYINSRVEELNALHRNMGEPDLPKNMVSVADMDRIKREISNRANWDKIFGNNSMTSAGDVRNGAISHYHGQLDGVGDTIPGYSDLNNRRTTLIHARDNVLGPIVDQSVGKIPSRTQANANMAVGGVRAALGNRAGLNQVGRGAAALESNTRPSALKIAKAMNAAVESNRSEGFTHPVHPIFNNTVDVSLAAQPNPNIQGEGFEITRQNVPPSSTEAQPMSKAEAYQREAFGKNRGDVRAMADAADAKAPVAGYTPELMDTAVKKNRLDAANEIRDMKKDAQLEGGIPMQTELSGGRLPRRSSAADRMSPYTDQTAVTPGIVKREGLGNRVPRRPRPPQGKTQYTDDRGLDPDYLQQLTSDNHRKAGDPVPVYEPRDFIDWLYQQEHEHHTNKPTGTPSPASASTPAARTPFNPNAPHSDISSFDSFIGDPLNDGLKLRVPTIVAEEKTAAAKGSLPRRKKATADTAAKDESVKSTVTPKAPEKPAAPATSTTSTTTQSTPSFTTAFDNTNWVVDSEGHAYELERIIQNGGRVSLKLKGQARAVPSTGFKPSSAPKKK